MATFPHHFQNLAEQSNKPKFPTETLSLSGLMQFVESAKKQSFEALCRLQPLVKTYRDKVMETSQAMRQVEASLGEGGEVPASYAASLAAVKDGFDQHLGALEQWTSAMGAKDEAGCDSAIAYTRQTGAQLEAALQLLSLRE
jgi:hypothetical protein